MNRLDAQRMMMKATAVFALVGSVACGQAPVAQPAAEADASRNTKADPAPRVTPSVDDVTAPAAPANPDPVPTPSRTAGPATAEQVPAEPAQPITHLEADVARSHVKLGLLKATGEHRLTFRRFDAAIDLDGDRVTGLQVDVHVDSLVASPAPFRADVLGSAFLHGKRHPVARFRSTHVDVSASDDARPIITGTLEIRGTTRPVTLPVDVEFSDTEVRGRGRLSFDVGEFGLSSPALDAEMVDPTVTLDLSFAFSRPSRE